MSIHPIDGFSRETEVLYSRLDGHPPLTLNQIDSLDLRIATFVEQILQEPKETLNTDLDRIGKVQEEMTTLRKLFSERHGIPEVAAQQHTDIITEQDIVETFYTLFLQAIEESTKAELISHEDLEDREPFLYPGLSALAMYLVFRESHRAGVNDGFLLVGNKTLSPDSAPEELQPFVQGFGQLRPMLEQIVKSGQESTFQQLLVGNPEKRVGEIKEGGLTIVELNRICAGIHNIASQLTQRPRFKQLIEEIFQVGEDITADNE